MATSEPDGREAVAVPDPRRAFHPRWLLPLTIGLLLPLLALTLYWLVWGRARAVIPLGGGANELAQLQQQHALLERALLALNEQGAALRAQCAPPMHQAVVPTPTPPIPPPPPPEPPPPPPPPPPEPPPPPPPPPEPPPPPPVPPVKKGEDMSIPQDLSHTKDMSFLKGCWQSMTGLRSANTDEPLVVTYCFDDKGHGERRVREQNGQDCVGSVAAAAQKNGGLRFQEAPALCPGGGGYERAQTTCNRGSQGQAECQGHSGAHSWGARYVHQ